MPYTPPSNRSPASSTTSSPESSRRPSLQSGARPALPRSASYLNKHRRTPSVTFTGDASYSSLTPQGTSEDLPAMAAHANVVNGGSVRQSPPPRTDENGMPKGAVISPPDSASSGSDDDGALEMRGRKNTKLKGLRVAVNELNLSTAPTYSPPTSSHKPDSHAVRPALPSRSMHHSFSTSSLPDAHKTRKSSHLRAITEPNVPVIKSADNSITASEEETDEDLKYKPQMVRKKSGELVRPALRASSLRRPSSMPGTPVFSKAVHFDSHLEHVRHFLQVDRPLAVSAGSSPVDNYESETEFPFNSDNKSGAKGPPFEWEIITPNFPHDSIARKALPVKLERLWLSPDHKTLLGSVAVANLAFQKHVSCRFTLDYWKTTSEVVAEYTHEIRPHESPLGHDRFTFSIRLSETTNLESKTLFLCIRYSVNGQEFWDNNNSANFQVDFRKKHLPQNGKKGTQDKARNALPRSNRRRNTTNGALRPMSMPVSLNEFANQAGAYDFDQPIHEYLGDSGSGLRFKSKSSNNIASDNIAKDLSSPSGAAFSNRYDFGASLTAAVQAAKDTMGKEKDKDALYMKSNVRSPRSTPLGSVQSSRSSSNVSTPTSNPSKSKATGTSSPVPSLPSSSYEELVNKYCFFGTKPQNPVNKDTTKNGGVSDGQLDGTHSPSKPSTSKSKVENTERPPTATHHTLHLPVSTKANSSAVVTTNDHTASRSLVYSPRPQTMAAHVVGSGSVAMPPPAGPIVTDNSLYGSQPSVPDCFHWRGDSHSTPTIRG